MSKGAVKAPPPAATVSGRSLFARLLFGSENREARWGDTVLSLLLIAALAALSGSMLGASAAGYALCAVVWTLVVTAVWRLPGLLAGRLQANREARQAPVVLAAAVLGTLISCFPVIFLGQSLLAPNNGPTAYFYPQCPTVPAQTDCREEDTRAGDTGAMAWFFFPTTHVQATSLLREGEFPLWNRYSMAGTSMVGQGQVMWGDPLTWLQWLVGVDAWSFDAKFVIARVVFAAAIGLSVLAITRGTAAAAVSAFAVCFIGYFPYRVSHTEIFTISYAPLVCLAWLQISLGVSQRRRFWWLAGLFAANWLLINSGTVKEAYMAALLLNLAGMLCFVLARRPSKDALYWPFFSMLLVSGICFAALILPIIATFLRALAYGVTAYDTPEVLQYAPAQALFLIDNVLYMLADGHAAPALNALLVIGFIAVILLGPKSDDAGVRAAVLSLGLAAALCLALAFGLVPAQLLLQIPFIRNINHIGASFAAILVVPASILAGVGLHLAAAEMRAGRQGLLFRPIAAILALLWLAFAWNLSQRHPEQLLFFAGYATVLLACGLGLAWLVVSVPARKLSFLGAALLAATALAVFWRGAMFPPMTGGSQTLLYQPGPRVSLTEVPEVIRPLGERLAQEPARVVGIGSSVVPGYMSALGLESISGPDAVRVATFQQLADRLGFRFLYGWWLYVTPDGLPAAAALLDLLGVRYVLSAEPLDGLTPIGHDRRMTLYERNTAWPRAFYTDRVEPYRDLPSLIHHLQEGKDLPVVAIESQAAAAAGLAPAAMAPSGTPARVVPATGYVLTTNTSSFTVEAPAAGVAYLGEVNVPGDFAATLNGKPVPILMANHTFKAIVIPGPGTYRVHVAFWPAHFTLYLVIAAAGAVTWLLAMAWFWRRLKDPVKAAGARQMAGAAASVGVNVRS